MGHCQGAMYPTAGVSDNWLACGDIVRLYNNCSTAQGHANEHTLRATKTNWGSHFYLKVSSANKSEQVVTSYSTNANNAGFITFIEWTPYGGNAQVNIQNGNFTASISCHGVNCFIIAATDSAIFNLELGKRGKPATLSGWFKWAELHNLDASCREPFPSFHWIPFCKRKQLVCFTADGASTAPPTPPAPLSPPSSKICCWYCQLRNNLGFSGNTSSRIHI